MRNAPASRNTAQMGQCPAREKLEEEEEVEAGEVTALMRSVATLERILRNDKPCGVLPSRITARPKSKGLMPRHEYLLD